MFSVNRAGVVHYQRLRRCRCDGQNQHSLTSTHRLHLPWGVDLSSFNLICHHVYKNPSHQKTFCTYIHICPPLSSIPQVFVLSGVIAMVTCAVFLRLNSLLKLAALLLAVAVYSYLIHLAFLALTRQDVLHRSRPTPSSCVLFPTFCSRLSMFFFFFTYWDFSWLCWLCWVSLQVGSQFVM